jgi:pyruvate formate lyase activating enzyme
VLLALLNIHIVYHLYIDFKTGWLYSVKMTSIGRIFDIKKFSINDGPGIRTTVFLQGCPLACPWCHNPEGRSSTPVLMYRANRCAGCGECAAVCPNNAIHLNGSVSTDRMLCTVCGDCVEACYNGAREISGRESSVADVLADVERDRPFYEQSGGGVTFSGGEPLLQPQFLGEILSGCKARGLHTVVDTSAYAPWEVLDNLRQNVDLFLIDLKLMDNARHQAAVGVSNRQIIDNLKRLTAAGHPVYVRIPLIPGINDDAENLRQSGEFLATLPAVTGVELMGYHEIGLAKYDALGLPYPLRGTRPPSAEQMQQAAAIVNEYELTVKVS